MRGGTFLGFYMVNTSSFVGKYFPNLFRCDLVQIIIKSVLSGFDFSLLAIIQSKASCKRCWTNDNVLQREM